ncbi:ABC transporter ATP-binding protein [Hydrogenimonas sp.]
MIELAIRKELQGAGGRMALEVALHIEKGSFVALTGESGSGKTTLLRILAGLERAEGRLVVDGKPWLEGGRALPPQKRRVGFVFQDYALFGNMTVRQNLLFVRNDEALADELLATTGLTALAHRYPATLSGGQKQRVALCRALMNRPRLLLMDEPLSALDPAMRSLLQQEILDLHRRFGTTTLMVSHDPAEIYRLADRVLVLHRGRLVEDGSPMEVLLKPSGSQKFAFTGELLDIVRKDAIHIAVVAIGGRLVEVVLEKAEAKSLKVGERVTVGAKAFAPTILPRR